MLRPEGYKNMKGISGIIPIVLNPTKVVIAVSSGLLFLSSIRPTSSLIMVSIHTFLLAVMTFTIVSSNSSLKPFCA
jgi:hypothetical protein